MNHLPDRLRCDDRHVVQGDEKAARSGDHSGDTRRVRVRAAVVRPQDRPLDRDVVDLRLGVRAPRSRDRERHRVQPDEGEVVGRVLDGGPEC